MNRTVHVYPESPVSICQFPLLDGQPAEWVGGGNFAQVFTRGFPKGPGGPVGRSHWLGHRGWLALGVVVVSVGGGACGAEAERTWEEVVPMPRRMVVAAGGATWVTTGSSVGRGA